MMSSVLNGESEKVTGGYMMPDAALYYMILNQSSINENRQYIVDMLANKKITVQKDQTLATAEDTDNSTASSNTSSASSSAASTTTSNSSTSTSNTSTNSSNTTANNQTTRRTYTNTNRTSRYRGTTRYNSSRYRRAYR